MSNINKQINALYTVDTLQDGVEDLTDESAATISGGIQLWDALSDLKKTNAEVMALNAAMQVEQARHTTLNKAIDAMNESVVKAGSTHRA